MIGESIAHYQITEKIGQGGMGEVYRARDGKLGRDVALKILPEIFSADAQRMARFQREAHLLASLNHANIASIYGVEESGGRRALVLELVEGDDLQARLRSGPLPIEEALDIARQIAEALEAAHEKGVIHRDLKPANVKLSPDGGVKVLDFGLAKALEGDPASSAADPSQSLSPTLTQAATRAGVILGTAAYMSPEQAKGKIVDRRTDIFAFGAVLFEMLAGKQSFAGETISDSLASVIKLEPEWGLLPPQTPRPVVDLLLRCLEKDPRQRLQSIGEARIAIQNMLRGGSEAGSGTMPAASAGAGAGRADEGRRGPGLAAWGASLVLVAAMAGAAGWLIRPAAPEAPPRRFTLLQDGLEPAYQNQPVVSPDGRRIALLAQDKLWIRDLDNIKPRLMPESEGARAFFWSPDGTEIAFRTGQELKRAPATGGTPTVVASLSIGRLDAGAWGEDGTMYLAPGNGPMYAVPSRGGDPHVFIPLRDGEESDFHTPSALPGGRGLVYGVHRAQGPDTIEVFSGGQRKILLRFEEDRIENPAYAPEGYLVFFRRAKNPGIWAVPFDIDTLDLAGEPFLLDRDGAFPSVAADGTLIYTYGAADGLRELVWVDRTGEITGTVGQPQEGMIFPALSPDGTRVLVSASPGENRDIWMHDVERGTRTRVTFSEDGEWVGSWLPGGDRVAFSIGAGSSGRTFSRAADGTDEPVEMGHFYMPTFSADGRRAAATVFSAGTASGDISTLSLEDFSLEPFLSTPAVETQAALSPDGAYVAYASDESGDREVYLKSFPGGEGKWQISLEGGFHPRWSRDGREIYFISGDPMAGLMVVQVTTRPTLRLSTPRLLFQGTNANALLLDTASRMYDVHPDGERFLVVRTVGLDRDAEPRLAITLNWVAAHLR